MKQCFHYPSIATKMADIEITQPIGATHKLNLTQDEPQQSPLIEVSPAADRILSGYSKIPAADVLPHVVQVRDGALAAVSSSVMTLCCCPQKH
jgi:hypothetical protein